VFENRGLRRTFGLKRDRVIGNEENYIMRRLMTCTPHQILFGDQIEKNGIGGHVAR
jgi:hypothetical protein